MDRTESTSALGTLVRRGRNTTMTELPNKIETLSADSRGRVNLGTDYADETVRVAVVEVVDADE